MGQLLPLTRTTPTIMQWGLASARSWMKVIGLPCTPITLACKYAQFAFETGYGVSCWWHNLGNERTGPLDPPNAGGWAGNYCELKTADEYDKDGNRIIVGGYFRAFASLDEGTEEHDLFLASLPRYRRAHDVLVRSVTMTQTEDNLIMVVSSFVDALKMGGYFTGDLSTYRGGCTSIARGFFANDWVDELAQGVDPRKPMLWKAVEAYPWWNPLQRVEGDNPAFDAIKSFFPEEYHDLTESDETHLKEVLACRYDCNGGVS